MDIGPLAGAARRLGAAVSRRRLGAVGAMSALALAVGASPAPAKRRPRRCTKRTEPCTKNKQCCGNGSTCATSHGGGSNTCCGGQGATCSSDLTCCIEFMCEGGRCVVPPPV
jgi:hypothetical protein